MTLADITDWVYGLGLTEHVYMSTLPASEKESIGVYSLSRSGDPVIAVGKQSKYGILPVKFLVHWNKYPRQGQVAATSLFNALISARDVSINEDEIKFFKLLVPTPQDVGPSDDGIYEYVIDAICYYSIDPE